MENDYFINAGISPAMLSWQALSSAMEIQTPQLNSTIEQSSECFFNPDWKNLTDQNVNFDSALSSMVSSPAASNNNISNDNFVIRELIGNVGNSGEMSPHSYRPFLGTHSAYISTINSATNSCYSTPLNSPPKVNLPVMDHIVTEDFPKLPNSMPLTDFPADPGFAARAAKFSSFGCRSFNGRASQCRMNNAEFPRGSNSLIKNGKLSRVLSSPSIKALGSQETKSSNSPLKGGKQLASSREESTVSEQKPNGELNSLNGESNSRKRKAISRGKAKEQFASATSSLASKIAETNDESAAKRCKSNENEKKDTALLKTDEKEKDDSAAEEDTQTKANQKPPEPPKDYIHVRARRGQATDSHSLAERVRREKISERMKLLQDLVPGCNKVTGKALMLDEIINYVQSLQQQVEFLSMKLSSVNVRPDFVNTRDTKKACQPNNLMPQPIFPLDSSISALYGHKSQQYSALSSNIPNGSMNQCSVEPLDSTLCHNLGMQLPSFNGFGEDVPQFPTFCENEVQTIARMDFGTYQSREAALQSQSFEGSNQVYQMKFEL